MIDLLRDICKPVFKLDFTSAWHIGVPLRIWTEITTLMLRGPVSGNLNPPSSWDHEYSRMSKKELINKKQTEIIQEKCDSARKQEVNKDLNKTERVSIKIVLFPQSWSKSRSVVTKNELKIEVKKVNLQKIEKRKQKRKIRTWSVIIRNFLLKKTSTEEENLNVDSTQ